MAVLIADSPESLGMQAAEHAARLLREAISTQNSARLLVSTGASQFETFMYLQKQAVAWDKVEMFHLDEYIGIGEDHKASFVRYLKERFTNHVPLKAAYFLNGLGNPEQVKAQAAEALSKAPIDVALIGIGENSHIAFNDPPADFDTEEAYITVTLDEACKQQQVREHWFPTLADVPPTAITMSVRQIMKSRVILSIVPHKEKALAVQKTLENELTNTIPATLLKTHPHWTLYLDEASASLLHNKSIYTENKAATVN